MQGFFMPGLGLALEVTWDGRGLGEHPAHFLNGGRYTPLMEATIIKDHAIVELRSPSTTSAQQAGSKLAQPHRSTVLFSKEFKKAEICHVNSRKSIGVGGDAGQEARDFWEAAAAQCHGILLTLLSQIYSTLSCA